MKALLALALLASPALASGDRDCIRRPLYHAPTAEQIAAERAAKRQAAELARKRAEALQDFQDCLDDRDLPAEDNDGECEEP